MLTYVLMGLLVLGIAFATLWGVKYDFDKNSFMSIEDTTFLRGFWCIIVVLVHIPAMYQNRVQDMLGSFAYIGVTFFFMTSAYGLQYSMAHKKGYMDYFWRRRLPSLLIPALIANAFTVIMNGLNNGWKGVTVLSFININAWVKVLLLMYVGFWLIYGLAPKFIGGGYWQNVLMVLFVFACSLIQRFTNFNLMFLWIVEPLGFAYGIVAAKYSKKIRKWLNAKWIVKTTVLMVMSGILGIAYLMFKPVPILGDYVLKILLGIAITVFMFSLIAKLKVGNKVNSFLGGISYEVYLLHHGVFALLMAIDKKVMSSGVFIVLSIISTIALAVLLKKLSDALVNTIKFGGR